MCGIVGVAGNLNQPEKKMFRDMLLFDVVRGQDSTGVLKVPMAMNQEPDIAKDIGSPLELWEFGQFNDMFDFRGVAKGMPKVLLGHNRAATIGAVTVDNAHPFNFGSVYGVHNGSLLNTQRLQGNHDVDSKCVYDTISQLGIDECWKNLNGAAALVWWDKENNTLNMVRNNQRPLYTAWNKGKSALFWASEPWMIRIAAMRNNVELESKNNVTVAPEAVPLDTFISYKVYATKVEKEEDRKLVNFQTAFPTNVGTTAHGYSGQVGIRSPKKDVDKEAKINFKWAEGLPKAGKEDRGRHALIRFCARLYNGGRNSSSEDSFNYYVVASADGQGERVEIYPETIKEYEKWESIKNAAGPNAEVKVRLKARPRYSVDKNGLRTLYISSKYIELVHVKKKKGVVTKVVDNTTNLDDEILFGGEEKSFRGYGGEMVTEEDLQRQIRGAGGTCLGCDDVLTVEDHKEIEWFRQDTMLCSHCSNDPYIANYING